MASMPALSVGIDIVARTGRGVDRPPAWDTTALSATETADGT